MPSYEAVRYLNDLRQSYWKSKSFDINTGDIMQKFEPQAMLDSFWIAKGAGNEGINVTQLSGGQNLGQLDDLNYFIKALYRALRVPSSRLNPESTTSVDGSTILQEEIRFAEFIISLQRIFAEAIKQMFITHLKLQGKYQEYKLQETRFDIEFVPPNSYYQMRELQTLRVKGDALSAMKGLDCFSTAILMKQIMGMSDNQVLQHYRLRDSEAAREWRRQQILANGPNWQKVQLMQQSGLGQGGGRRNGTEAWTSEVGGGGLDMRRRSDGSGYGS